MTQYPDEEIKYTPEDLLGALAAELGSSADDPRIIDAYDQVVSGWARHALDRDAANNVYFESGPVASELDMRLAKAWATGRILIDRCPVPAARYAMAACTVRVSRAEMMPSGDGRRITRPRALCEEPRGCEEHIGCVLTTKLAVAVAVDMDATIVTLKPAGRLTADNVRALVALVGRAGRVLPGFEVHLDLNHLHVSSPGALRTLSGAGAKALTALHRGPARRGYRPELAARAAA